MFLKKTGRFWQLVGGPHERRPEKPPPKLGAPSRFRPGGLGYLPSKGKRQAAQGAAHAPNENMLTYQCTTLGATVALPCLCTTVEVAVIRQGAGKWAVRARPTGDRPAPPGSLGFRVRQHGLSSKEKPFTYWITWFRITWISLPRITSYFLLPPPRPKPFKNTRVPGGQGIGGRGLRRIKNPGGQGPKTPPRSLQGPPKSAQNPLNPKGLGFRA